MTSLEDQPELDLRDLESAASLAVLATSPGGRVVVAGEASPEIVGSLAERGCRVVAVVHDGPAAEAVRSRAEAVHVGGLEELAASGMLEEDAADSVLLLGALERAPEPTSLLRTAQRLVEPGGRVVASVPNATHGAARLRMLRGELPESASGALDRTPERLYDRARAEELVEAAELPSAEVLSVRRAREDAVEAGGLSEAAVAEAWSGEDASVAEFVIVSRMPASEPGPVGEPTLLGRHRERIAILEAALAEAEAAARRSARELDEQRGRLAELEASARRADDLEQSLRERMQELEDANGALKLLKHDLLVKERYIAELRAEQEPSSRRGLAGKRPASRIGGLSPSRGQQLVVSVDRSLRRFPAAHRVVRAGFRGAKRAARGRASSRR
jgi:SAM-dependent methyltransferase